VPVRARQFIDGTGETGNENETPKIIFLKIGVIKKF